MGLETVSLLLSVPALLLGAGGFSLSDPSWPMLILLALGGLLIGRWGVGHKRDD